MKARNVTRIITMLGPVENLGSGHQKTRKSSSTPVTHVQAAPHRNQ